MPYLFCPKHGQEHATTARDASETYRELGESVLLASGPLKNGPWACDSCNATLGRGKRAWLMTPFPAWITAGMDCYDFAYERLYFDLRKTAVTLYGSSWPGGEIAAMLREAIACPR